MIKSIALAVMWIAGLSSVSAYEPISQPKDSAELLHASSEIQSNAFEYKIRSKFITEEPTIQVFLPDDYDQQAEHVRYPVIYTLDGWILAKSVSGVVHHLGHTAAMPKAIVVAVHLDNEYAYGPNLYQSKSGWGDDPNVRLSVFSGGKADEFLKFLQTELVTSIDGRFRTNDFRAIVGMSPTATIALHTFWKSPELFDAHIVFAATDVLGMGYSPDTTFIDKFTESLSSDPNRKGYLYIASAKQESERSPIRYETAKALRKALRPYTAKQFRLRVDHIEDTGHYSMAIQGMLQALELIFPSNDFEMSGRFNAIIRGEGNALQEILALYERLSDQVGFEVYPNLDLRRNASCIRTAAYRTRSMNKLTQSEELYRYWLKQNPNSYKAYAGLAETLFQMGHKEEAEESLKSAISIVETNKPKDAEDYQAAYLKRLVDYESATSQVLAK